MIAENVKTVLAEIHDTALRSGRDPSEITLVAVTKIRTADEIEQAIQAGITHLGENRVQEANSKIPSVKSDAVWHLVGHLQSNKVKKAAMLFNWIDSVDSEKIADLLSLQAVESEKTLDVLIQVGISDESSKSGVSPDEPKKLVLYTENKKGLTVRGLMTIGSFGVSKDVTRNEFARMKALFEDLQTDSEVRSRLDVLSMGMSDDYLIAIEEGSTMVRIGTAIFGQRS